MRSIALAGPMASGKTAVAHSLSNLHGFAIHSFGDVVRAEADAQGIPRSDRSALQTLGQTLVEAIGAQGMIDRLLGSAVGDVVIDGVRHVAVLESLRQRLPSLTFGFVSAHEVDLDTRWAARNETLSREQASTHSVEADLGDLRQCADIVANSSQLSAVAIADILAIAASDRTATRRS